MILLYILGVFIAFYLIISATIRIKMHFWHTQPVFHLYNLIYWLKPPGVINSEPPPVNKFVNLSNNTLINVNDISNTSIAGTGTSAASLCKFISDNYIIHESASYKPSEQDIMAYLECSNQPSFFNVYQETQLPYGSSDREIIGLTSARLLNVTLVNKKKPISLQVYYIDNLCVKPGYRNKGIAPELIQTFYYTISRANPKVNAYMFKREGQLNAIVPLVCYDTHVFDMTNFREETIVTASMNVIEIGIQQLNLLIAFIKAQMPRFDCIVLPDVSCVMNLIKLGKIKIYGIIFKGELIAVYVFRLLELYYGDKKAAECITIISNCKTPDILIAGFSMSWLKLTAVVKCAIVFIEGTAHSGAVIKALSANPHVLFNFKSPTAFFLYNYAAYSVKKTKTILFY
jgi:hypothetical protein